MDKNTCSNEMFALTELFCKAFARYDVPWLPISLISRWRLVNIWENDNGKQEKYELKIQLTWLLCNTLARYRAPSEPMLFHPRSSSFNVYVEW